MAGHARTKTKLRDRLQGPAQINMQILWAQATKLLARRTHYGVSHLHLQHRIERNTHISSSSGLGSPDVTPLNILKFIKLGVASRCGALLQRGGADHWWLRAPAFKITQDRACLFSGVELPRCSTDRGPGHDRIFLRDCKSGNITGHQLVFLADT